jgi:hypothetical protein
MDPNDSTERAARTVLSNLENRKLDSKMKEDDSNNDSNEMRVPQDLTGIAALRASDQNKN